MKARADILRERSSPSYNTPLWSFILAAALTVAFQLLYWLGNFVAMAMSLLSPDFSPAPWKAEVNKIHLPLLSYLTQTTQSSHRK